MKKLRCLVFIEADVVVRHFIHSNSFSELCKKHEVKFIFPEKGNKRFNNIEPKHLNIQGKYAYLDHNKNRYDAWKRMFHIDQLRFSPGPQAKAMRDFRRKTLKWKAASYYTILGLPIIWDLFKLIKKRQLLMSFNIDMQNLIKNFKPDILIHPCVLEGLFLNDLIQISKYYQIPSIVIMNSWDNPSTKNAMIGTPDWLLVWGEQTKNHAIKYCKMHASNVVKFGAAQFDIYNKLSKLSKSDFKTIYKISDEDFILLYAGSSKGTNEIKQLNMLEKAINEGILKNLKIIYRPHPWGQGGQNGSKIIDMKWKNILFDKSMVPYLSQLKKGIKTKFLSNYEDTHDILSNVDGVVSPLSTILIEAAIHGKPSLCFLPDEDQSLHFKIDSALIHFHDFFDSALFLKAAGYDNLIPKIMNLIEFSKTKDLPENLKKEANYYVKKFKSPYATRLNSFVETICMSGKNDK